MSSYVTDGSVERRKTSPLKKITIITNIELYCARILFQMINKIDKNKIRSEPGSWIFK